MSASAITLNRACDIAIKEGKAYKRNLANYRFLVIYRDRESNKIMSLEVVFQPSNYQHLTGLDLIDEKKNIKPRSSVEFYHKCVSGRLIPAEIRFHDEFTTSLKLECLPRLTGFTRITRIAGAYNNSKPRLVGDYLLGGQGGCIAVSLNEGGKDYYPRSAINEDIRDLVTASSQVLAIMRTRYNSKVTDYVYSEICYQARGVDITKVALPEDIQNQISFLKE